MYSHIRVHTHTHTHTHTQVAAIIVIVLGVLMVIPFHIVVREKDKVLKKLKWYLWLIKPDFYLVSRIRSSLIPRPSA